MVGRLYFVWNESTQIELGSSTWRSCIATKNNGDDARRRQSTTVLYCTSTWNRGKHTVYVDVFIQPVS